MTKSSTPASTSSPASDSAPRASNRPTPESSRAADRLVFRAVHLNVRDLETSLLFWRDAVGLTELARNEDKKTVTLGVTQSADMGQAEGDSAAGGDSAAEGEPLLVLHAGATLARQRKYTDMYHLALHVSSEQDFANTLARLTAHDVQHAPTDHVMHWATYATDPDGIEVEIAFETLDRFARAVPSNTGTGMPLVETTSGELKPATGPLDLKEVMSHFSGDEIVPPSLGADTRIGHMHMYGIDPQQTTRFYTETLGFTLNAAMESVGMYDFAAGGPFRHRLAFNTWLGSTAEHRPEAMAGMRYVELEVRDQTQREKLLSRSDDGKLTDPAGNTFLLRP